MTLQVDPAAQVVVAGYGLMDPERVLVEVGELVCEMVAGPDRFIDFPLHQLTPYQVDELLWWLAVDPRFTP